MPDGVLRRSYCRNHEVRDSPAAASQHTNAFGSRCAVCVTSGQDIDRAIALARLPGVIITTFGDMLKVLGSRSNLQKARAEGCDVRVIYSTQDALQVARDNPLKAVVLIGIGFETTSPTVAAAILQAEKEGLKNFSVLCLLKMTPPPMKALLELGEIGLDGIICPGHVSAIIGTQPYQAYARDYGVACVVAGFEPVDILQAVEMLVEQVEKGRPAVEIAYRRGVKPEGNPRALELIEQCFDIAGATWRGWEQYLTAATVLNRGLRFLMLKATSI